MSSKPFDTAHWAEQHRTKLTTQQTHQDVLTDPEFERQLEACERLPEARRFEARLISLQAGCLGLRAGEITHITTEWIDWDRILIRIPEHEPFDCGY